MRIVISMDGKSEIKNAALSDALRTCGLADLVDIRSVVARSTVPEQPIGSDEICAGARSRALAAQAAAPDTYAIGIESGIRKNEKGEWFDVAFLVILWPCGREQKWESYAYRIPTDAVEKALAEGPGKTTFGQVLARENPGCDHRDPHSFLSNGNTTRKGVLTNLLVKVLKDGGLAKFAENFTIAQDMQKHLIEINGVRRLLPIKEVKPGLRLAVLDVLGDWELNVALGSRLALKIREAYPDVNALFMPDGKAQALLHEVSKNLELPSYVARKVIRPVYAGPDPLVVSYGNEAITSQGTSQQLVISRATAICLRGRKVVIVDDVVSTGASLEVSKEMLAQVGASYLGTACAFTEGGARPGVISLGDLPLYKD